MEVELTNEDLQEMMQGWDIENGQDSSPEEIQRKAFELAEKYNMEVEFDENSAPTFYYT